MKFGLMYEIQIPEPHYPGIVKDTYNQVLAQVVLAEEMGFQYFWTVEHHFLTEFSYCRRPKFCMGQFRSAPIKFVSAMRLRCCRRNTTIQFASLNVLRSSIS
jgi:alkanesulfonate monooxygenase SsuD/methylene tetrahydromethanopterin reductase-like flavin-dependent oxidoreductase (luciferase family)